MRNALRYAAINLTVLLGLLIGLNISAIVLYQGLQTWRFMASPAQLRDPRSLLPNYEGVGWAEAHFEELKRARVEYHSFYGWRREPFSGTTITVDERGIRPTPGSASQDQAAPLVVFLGGSTMWGEGANDENTIPAHFVRHAKMPLRVENLGESAYNAFQGYLFLKFRILEGWRPDLVVSYDGINNVEGLCRAGNRAIGHGRELQIRTAMRGLDQVRTPDALTLRYFIMPIREIIMRLRKRTDSQTPDNPYRLVCAADPNRAQNVAQGLLDSWLATLNLIDSHGGESIFVLQPAAYTGKPMINHLSVNPATKLEYEAVYGRIINLLDDKKYSRLRGRVLNLLDALDDHGTVYIDPQHVSPLGNEIMANHLLGSDLVRTSLFEAFSDSKHGPRETN